MFRSAFKRNRCIVPASGYYEWQAADGGKQPHYVTPAHDTVLSIAGLWDEMFERLKRENEAHVTERHSLASHQG